MFLGMLGPLRQKYRKEDMFETPVVSRRQGTRVSMRLGGLNLCSIQMQTF